MDKYPGATEQRPVLLDSGLEDHILIFGSAWVSGRRSLRFWGYTLPSTGQASTNPAHRTSDPGVIPGCEKL